MGPSNNRCRDRNEKIAGKRHQQIRGKAKIFEEKQLSNGSNILHHIISLQPIYHKHSILHDYKISKQVLGTGFSGTVRLVRRRLDGKKFALKVLPDLEYSRREIALQYLASSHPHIVQIIDVYKNKVRGRYNLYVVLEYMSGGILYKKMEEHRLTERDAARIMHDLGSAVEHIHSFNIAHRDIKPENVMYNNKNILKLGDFGFAKQGNDDDTKPLRTACYTYLYVPPEILHRVCYDKSCDMWSLGVLMYIILCGYPPFHSECAGLFTEQMKRRIKAGDYSFPSPDWDNISDTAKNVVRKLLVINPAERMTIQEFMQHPWITDRKNAPKCKLKTLKNLTEENITEIEDTLKQELTNMRTDYVVTLKPLVNSESAMLQRRKRKNSVAENSDGEFKSILETIGEHSQESQN